MWKVVPTITALGLSWWVFQIAGRPFSGRLAELALNLIGSPAIREGDLLLLPYSQISVAAVCGRAGVLLALWFLAFLYGHYSQKRTAVRCALLFSALPVPVVINAIRLTASGLFVASMLWRLRVRGVAV